LDLESGGTKLAKAKKKAKKAKKAGGAKKKR
jgi:hypothetical protein